MWLPKMKKFLVIFFVFLISLNVFSMQQENIDWNNKELIIKGEYLHAVLIAEKDFSARMAEKSSLKGVKTDARLAEYLSNIDNYNIEIGSGKGRFLIWFIPRLTTDFPVIFGSDALYTIDSKTFQMLDKQFGK